MLSKVLVSLVMLALVFPVVGIAAIHQVNISNFAFVPGHEVINQGDTVRWTNMDLATHTSTSDQGVWNSGDIINLQSYSRAFDSAGVFPYHCNYHPSMMDTITVIPLADWNIEIGDFFFNPAVLQIQPGQTVRWTNNGAHMHTSTSDNSFWNSDTLNPGQFFDHTFPSEGVYPYHCELHPLLMKGTIIVGRPDSVAGDIHIIDFAFVPAETTISVGQNIRWINFGPSQHTTTDTSAHLWDSGVLNPGQVFTLHANVPGAFHYICNIHTQMAGLLTVADTISGSGCSYLDGDINGSGNTNGLDVVYGVSYLKGGPPPPYSCDCPPHGTFYVAGDVNASCNFNGLDITYYVSYLKGGPALQPCPSCPPAR